MASSVDTDLPMNLLIPSAVAIIILSAIGLYGNGCIFWVTAKFKNFQTPCGILIALLAVGDFGHQIGHIVYSAMIFSGTTFISQRSCFWIQIVPAIFMQHSVIVLAVLGVDRLICLTRPILYRSVSASKRLRYVLILNVIPALYIAALVTVSYTEMTSDPNKETLCIIVSFFAGNAEQYWIMSATFLTTATVIIYVYIWVNVWRQAKQASEMAIIKSALKPLTIILTLTFFGWFLGMALVSYVSTRTDLNNGQKIGWISYAGLFVNLSVSANYFVYRVFGLDYKRAFRKMWTVNTLSVVTIS